MNLKEKVELFLKTRKKTFKDLAIYIDESEEELSRVLSGTSVEIRILEKISKALRIPLFSFLHEDELTKKEEIPYYYNRLPETKEELYISQQRDELLKQIELLKFQLNEKEAMLKMLYKK